MRDETTPLKPFAIFALAALFFWGGAFLFGLVVMARTPETLELFGQFGDMFGLINCLFTAVAMCGAVWTIFLQTKQLEEQKNQFLIERANDERLFRSSKFEKYITSMYDLKTVLTEVASTLRNCTGTEDRRFETLVPLIAAYRPVRVYALLYFSSHGLPMELAPKDLLVDVCSKVNAFFYEGNTPRKKELHMEMLKEVVKLSDQLTSITDAAILASENFVSPPLKHS